MDAELCGKLGGVFNSNTKKCHGIFTADELRKHWGNEKPIAHKDKKYRVGKMSYGDYFLEPVMTEKEKKLYYGETKPFHPETLWLEKVERRPYFFKVEKQTDFI